MDWSSNGMRLAIGLMLLLTLLLIFSHASSIGLESGPKTLSQPKAASTNTNGQMESASAAQASSWVEDKQKMLDLQPSTTTTHPPSTTTTVPPSPPVTTLPAPSPSTPTYTSSGVDWYAIAQCESNGDWHINTGNGYYGGLQFSHSTWIAYGGGAYAENAHLTSRENQIAVASGMGLSHWPHCGQYG
jgi:hypothetical protein